MEGAAVIVLFLSLLILAIVVALIPFIIANSRNHPFKWVILVLCLFAPTVVFWVVALAWAVWPQDRL